MLLLPYIGHWFFIEVFSLCLEGGGEGKDASGVHL